MGYSTILVDRTDGVATITLNRPEARNALDLVMRRELLSVLDELDADTACRVVVLTGAGGHFSAGGDVKTMAARRHTAAEGRARVESLNRFVVRLFEFPKPTIAMVDGFAVGAGCNIALACDMVIASDRARFIRFCTASKRAVTSPRRPARSTASGERTTESQEPVSG